MAVAVVLVGSDELALMVGVSVAVTWPVPVKLLLPLDATVAGALPVVVTPALLV